jgi:ABC-type branched-subunit amino acid transport system substrate-binding protein
MAVPQGGRRRRAARRLGLVVGVATAAVLVAACSSSGPGSSGSSAGNVGGGEPIKIFAQGTYSLPGGGGLYDIYQGVVAATDAVNAAGGINGHKLALTKCDDGGSPSAAIQCTETQIAAGAVAEVGEGTAYFQEVEPYLAEAGVPVVGGNNGDLSFGTSDVAFAFSGGAPSAFVALPEELKAAGATKVNLIYPSDLGSAGAENREEFILGAKMADIPVGNITGIPTTTADFGPAVAHATAGGVNGVASFMPGAGEAQLIKTLHSDAPNVKVAATSFSMTPSVISSLGSSGNGLLVSAVGNPYAASDAPWVKLYQEQLAKYQPGAPLDDDSLIGWSSVWALAQVGKTLPSITRSSLLAAMRKLNNFSLGGAFANLTTTAHPCQSGCLGQTNLYSPYVIFYTLENGKLTPKVPGQLVNPYTNKTVENGIPDVP